MLQRTQPPSLAELRTLLRAFCQKHRIRRLEPVIRRLTIDLLEPLAQRGHADGVMDFAVPLAVSIMCEQVGIDHADAHRIGRWVEAFGAVRGELTHERLIEETRR